MLLRYIYCVIYFCVTFSTVYVSLRVVFRMLLGIIFRTINTGIPHINFPWEKQLVGSTSWEDAAAAALDPCSSNCSTLASLGFCREGHRTLSDGSSRMALMMVDRSKNDEYSVMVGDG